MAGYTINHDYRSFRDGQPYGPWTAGDVIELDDETAAWLDRDSPGLLTAAKPKADPEPEAKAEAERQQPAGKDRQHRGGRTRSA